MILINALGIQDSGGIVVLEKVLGECSVDKSNDYLIVCDSNKNSKILYDSYKDTSNFIFKIFEIKNLIHRLFIENITFRTLKNEFNVKLLYQFSGSAQLFSRTPQLIKLHNLIFFCRILDKQYLAQKRYYQGLLEVFIRRQIFSYMTKQCEFIEMQSRHVQWNIEDYLNISNKKLFFKSDVCTNTEEFSKPVMMGQKSKLTLIYIVGPHFEVVHKNFCTFVQAALKLKKDGIDFDIAITLTKEQLHSSSLWCASLDNRTKFLGYLPKHELMGVFKGNSVLISTSIIESLGLHVIEAIQNGVSVIVPNEKYSLEVYGPSVSTYETLNADSLAGSIKVRSLISQSKLSDMVEKNQAYIIKNEKLKLQSIVEIFKIIIDKNYD